MARRLPYMFALALAYLMAAAGELARPPAHARDSRRHRKATCAPLAILLVYLLTIGALVLFFSLVVPVITQQFEVLWDSRCAVD